MRFVARVFIFLIALVFLTGPALYLARESLGPFAVSWAARIGLGIDDLGDLRFHVSDLDRDNVTIEGVSAAGGRIAAEKLHVTFDLGEVLSGRVRAVTVTGLTLRARYADGEIDLGPFEALRGRDTATTMPFRAADIPVDRLRLEDARLVLSMGASELEVVGDFGAEVTPGGPLIWSGKIRGHLSSDALGGGEAQAVAMVDGELDRAGEIRGSVELKRSDARFRDLSVATARGGISARIPVNARPMLRAALEIGQTKARETVISGMSLDVYTQGDSGSLSAVIGDPATPEGDFTLVGDFRPHDNGRAKLSVSGEGALELVHGLLGPALESPLMAVAGDLSFNGDFGFPNSLEDILGDPGAILGGAAGIGRVEIGVSTVEHAGKSYALEARAGMTMTVAPGFLEARATTRSRVRLPKASALALARLLPEQLRPWFEDGLTVAPQVDGAPLTVLASHGGGTPNVHVVGGLSAEFGATRTAMLGGMVSARPESKAVTGPWSAELDGAFLRAGGFEIDGHSLQDGEADFSGAVGPDGVAGRFSLKAKVGPEREAPVGESNLDIGGEIVSADQETKISLSRLNMNIGPSAAGVSREQPEATGRNDAANDIGFALLESLMVSVAPDTVTEVIFSHPIRGIPPRVARASLDVGMLSLGRVGDQSGEAIEVEIGRVTGSFETRKDRPGGRVTLEIDRAGVSGGGRPIRLSELSFNAGFEGEDPIAGVNVAEIAITEVAMVGTPVWMTPIKVALNGRREGRDAVLNLQGSIIGVTSSLNIPISGRLRLDDYSGQLAVEKTWLEFGPEAMSLAALSPALASSMEALRGRVGLDGHFAWPDTDERGGRHASIEIEGLTAEAGGVAVENASGGIAFKSFAPPRSDGAGILSMDMLGVGVPILRPRLEVTIDGLEDIVARRILGEFAGGRISASDIAVSLDQPIRAEILAQGVDAAILSTLIKVEGLDAEGSLSGVLPVIWSPGLGLTISDARLSADGPGIVRYKAGEKDAALRQSGEQVGLMLDALSDFRFQTLEMGVAGAPGDGFRVDLALEGANPNLYDGYPVRFNLDLVGQLDDIIKTGYRTYTLPDRVRDAVLRGEAND